MLLRCVPARAVPLASLFVLACGDATAQTASDGTGASTSTATEPDTTTGTGALPTTADATTTPTGEPGTSTTTGTDTGTSAPASVSDTGTSTSSSAGGSTTDEPACPQGEVVCDGDTAQVCDGMGGFESAEDCPAGCVPGVGCIECEPGTSTCEGAVALKCAADGSGYIATPCDEVQDVTCDPDAGACVGACAPETLGLGSIGCDYYPTVTANEVPDSFHFAVAVANASDEDADVTITRGDEMVADILVPKQSVEIVHLPWVLALKAPSQSVLVQDGAYRLRSTRPVAVHQYSPIEHQLGADVYSTSNDASLLLPAHAWGQDTLVIARNTTGDLPGLYAIVAREDDTLVEVTPSSTGAIVHAGDGIAADGAGTVVLGAGDVLEVLSASGGGRPNTPDVSDLTGTRVTSNKPVQVIGGHACTNIPFNAPACDHLEETNLPVASLGKDYLVTVPYVKGLNQPPMLNPRRVRIVATTDGTTLSYDPPQPGAPTEIAEAGDYVELHSVQDFRITANFKIAVAQYMLGSAAGGGEPSMTIAAPIEQLRTRYTFHTPNNYESNFIDIIAPTDAALVLDGFPTGGFSPIGQTGRGVLRLQLLGVGEGDHTITGDKPFEVQVYGYGQHTSYWHPAGLDLAELPR